MEQQKLPNSTLILVFGIISILSCCCYGIGIIFAIIALVMAKKATALYLEAPEQYSGYQNVKTGKILSYIGLIICAIWLGYIVYMYATYGLEGMRQMNEETFKDFGL